MIKKIGFFIHTGSISGPNNSLIQLIRKLDKQKYYPTIYSPTFGDAIREFKKMGVKCRIIHNRRIERNPILYPLFICELIRTTFKIIYYIYKDKLNIIHINTAVTLSPGLAAKIVGLPIIWHIRESLKHNTINTLYLKVIFNLATSIITVSKSVSRELLKRTNVYSEKLFIIHNGVEPKDYELDYNKKGKKTSFDLPLNKILIAVPAFLHPAKGHLVLLKAIKYLKEQKVSKDFLVLILGDDPSLNKNYYNILNEYVRNNNIGDSVKFLGRRKDIVDFLYISDIICLSPIYPDPFPRAVLEGMAAGKPVVASNTGGIPEMVIEQETGLLVKPKDPKALAIALKELIENKDKSLLMGNNGKKVVKEKLSSTMHAKKVQIVYSSIL